MFYLMFLRDIRWRYLPLEDADDEQSNFAAKLKNLDKSKETIKKKLF